MNKVSINIKIFSRFRTRLIATVISHVHSTRFNFLIIDESSTVLPDIALVEFGDADTQARLTSLIERNKALQVVELVTAKDQLGGHRYQIFGAHLVSDLIPMLDRVANNMRAEASAQTMQQAAPQIAAQIAAQIAPQAVPQVVDAKVVRLPTKPQRERLRALVVDDSPTVRQQLAVIVDRLGLRCDTAESGAAALELLEDNAYNIVYVDVVMPDMDGYRLTREIKRNKAHKAIPVIILTSKSSPFDRARGALAGCDTYLTKPVELKRFFEATRSCLVKNRAVADSHDWITDPTMLPQPAAATVPSPALGFSTDALFGNASRKEFTGLRMGGLRPSEV